MCHKKCRGLHSSHRLRCGLTTQDVPTANPFIKSQCVIGLHDTVSDRRWCLRNISIMIGDMGKIPRGYIVFLLLIGLQSISPVSLKDNLNWVQDYVHVGPGPVILVSPSENYGKECDEKQTDECLKKLQTFLKLTSLPFTSDKAELDKLCSTLIAGYNCSTKLTLANCLSARDKSLFPIFVDMAQYTMFMFCSSGDGEHGYLRDTLLHNSDCIKEQKQALRCCADESKLPDLPVMHILEENGRNLVDRQIAACCPVSNYLRCVRAAVEPCGQTASNFTTEYIRRASGQEMDGVCQKMQNYPDLEEGGVCKASVPVCSGTVSLSLGSTTVLIIFFVTLMNKQNLLNY